MEVDKDFKITAKRDGTITIDRVKAKPHPLNDDIKVTVIFEVSKTSELYNDLKGIYGLDAREELYNILKAEAKVALKGYKHISVQCRVPE